MKKSWKKVFALGCAASLFMSLPGSTVLAAELQDEMMVTNAEVVEEIEESEYKEESENEKLSEAEDVDVQEFEEHVVGAGYIAVGDNVTATFDSSTGAVEFYSNGGTLWKDWIKKSGIDVTDINSIGVASGTVYLPSDSESIFEISVYDKNEGTYISGLTEIDLKGFNTSKVTSMSKMFFGCSSLMSLDFSGFNTSYVTDMSWMFYGCSSITSLDLSSFNTSKVKSMKGIFFECKSLADLDLSNINTANVTDMSDMFEHCDSLIYLDLSNFNTSNVLDMSFMFYECRNLKNLNLNSFDSKR